jgi:hypothetical protein
VLFVLRWPYRRRNLHIVLHRFVPTSSPNGYDENNETMRCATPDAGLQRSEVHSDVQQQHTLSRKKLRAVERAKPFLGATT